MRLTVPRYVSQTINMSILSHCYFKVAPRKTDLCTVLAFPAHWAHLPSCTWLMSFILVIRKLLLSDSSATSHSTTLVPSKLFCSCSQSWVKGPAKYCSLDFFLDNRSSLRQFHYSVFLLLVSLPLCPFCLSPPGPRQKEGPGGDQGLHHPVSGQRRLPDQRLSQQCAAAARHPGIATATHGVFHQPHLPGTVHTSATGDRWPPKCHQFFIS